MNTINNNMIDKMIAFAVGTLLGDVLLHMLPHLLESNNYIKLQI